jgi:hypothetical protein
MSISSNRIAETNVSVVRTGATSLSAADAAALLSALPPSQRSDRLSQLARQSSLTSVELGELSRLVPRLSETDPPVATSEPSDEKSVERLGKPNGESFRFKQLPGKKFDEATFNRWYDAQALGSSKWKIYLPGNDPATGDLRSVAVGDRAQFRDYVKQNFAAFQREGGWQLAGYSTMRDAIASSPIKFDREKASALVDSFRQFGLILDTEGLAKKISEIFADDPEGQKQFERFLVDQGLVSLAQSGEMQLTRDRSLGGQAYDMVREGSRYLLDTVFGTVETAVALGKVAYDTNPVGYAADALRNLGVNIPDALPSPQRNATRILEVSDALVAAGKRVYDDPSILIARHKDLYNEGRYGALAVRSTLDVITLVTTLKSAAASLRKLAADPLAAAQVAGKTPDELRALAKTADDLAVKIETKAPADLKRLTGYDSNPIIQKDTSPVSTVSRTTKTAPLSREAAAQKAALIAGASDDPLVAARIKGGSKTSPKGTYYEEGSKAFDRYSKQNESFVIVPRSQAEALGFDPVGGPRRPRFTPLLDANGRQLESSGAGTGKGLQSNVTARAGSTANRERSFTTGPAAARAEFEGYQFLLKNGELGIKRPGNVSTSGVDAITVRIEGDKTRLFLNDFTTPGVSKGPKPNHRQWLSELDEAMRSGSVDFGDAATNAQVRAAWQNGEVYVRTVRVEPTGIFDAAKGQKGVTVTFDPETKP